MPELVAVGAAGKLGGVEEARDVAVALEGDLLGRRRLDVAAGGLQLGQEAGGVAPALEAVAPGQKDRDRQLAAAGAAELVDQEVAGQHAGRRDLPVAEVVVVRRVAAGEVDHQLRLEFFDERRQARGDGAQVGLVVHLVAERDRGRLHGFGVAPVPGVHRVGVHGGVVAEDVAGAVAVVQVEVDHQDRSGEAVAALVGDRQGDVVEDAEAAALPGMGMVVAAAEVDREALAPAPAAPPSGCRRPAAAGSRSAARPARAAARSRGSRSSPRDSRAASRYSGVCTRPRVFHQIGSGLCTARRSRKPSEARKARMRSARKASTGASETPRCIRRDRRPGAPTARTAGASSAKRGERAWGSGAARRDSSSPALTGSAGVPPCLFQLEASQGEERARCPRSQSRQEHAPSQGKSYCISIQVPPQPPASAGGSP